MQKFLPDPLFRALAPAAQWLRHRWRQLRQVPLRGATMIARDFQDRVLLVRHTYGPDGWHLPGGGIGRGESPERAAIRELVEETGCTAQGVQPVGVIEETISGSPHTAHVFACVTQDVPRTDRREIAEARFFPMHSLPVPLGALTRSRLTLWQARD